MGSRDTTDWRRVSARAFDGNNYAGQLMLLHFAESQPGLECAINAMHVRFDGRCSLQEHLTALRAG